LASAWSKKRKVMRSYDSTARIYDARYGDEQEAKYRVALENVKPKGTVLDVGCGSGLFFSHIVDEAEAMVGVDSSQELLLEARKRALGLQNVHLVKADADHLPFSEDFFDVVFAFTVLQNMPKPVETLKELGRVAKPGAPVVVTGLRKVFSISALCDMIGNAGLHIVSIVDDALLKCYLVFTLKFSA